MGPWRKRLNFYPRSPCGERLSSYFAKTMSVLFLSTLSLRRATLWAWMGGLSCNDFYPRSPCGERLLRDVVEAIKQGFLSTLSLRRATVCFAAGLVGIVISIHALLAESDNCTSIGRPKRLYFYPRSPCGERHTS